MKFLVRLEDVSKSFGPKQVFNHFNLEVQPGEVTGLSGPSGSGKTTLLRLISGLERPDSGQVRQNAARLGVVFQEPRLLPGSTAIDNVALVLRARGTTKKEARSRAGSWLERMELNGAEHAFPDELSGGMKQRVAMARALAVEPDLLLLDEPFNGLDPKLKTSIRDLFVQVVASGRTAVIHVTHHPEDLIPGASRLVRLG